MGERLFSYVPVCVTQGCGLAYVCQEVIESGSVWDLGRPSCQSDTVWDLPVSGIPTATTCPVVYGTRSTGREVVCGIRSLRVATDEDLYDTSEHPCTEPGRGFSWCVRTDRPHLRVVPFLLGTGILGDGEGEDNGDLDPYFGVWRDIVSRGNEGQSRVG